MSTLLTSGPALGATVRPVLCDAPSALSLRGAPA